MREFYFYLDAWFFCKENKILLENISRLNWKTWVVKVE